MRTKMIVITLVAVFTAISVWAWRASAEGAPQPNGIIGNGTINLNESFGKNRLSQDQTQPLKGLFGNRIPVNPNGGFQLGAPGTQTFTTGSGSLGTQGTTTFQVQTFSLGCGGILTTSATGTGTVTLTSVTLSMGAVPTVRQVLNDDEAIREKAIQTLRGEGPMGFQLLLDTYSGLIEQYAKSVPSVTAAPVKVVGAASGNPPVADAREIIAADEATKWARVKVALDAVGAQKDNHTAKLYWYTDLEAAKAAAKESGKPILSLRLLGKLTDELSCANSRFSRTMLYPNAEINKVLRENYILHWETVRNVPVVTIDYGDGRKIVRTLTGNSIHYVLDSEGRPIEAIPGLYGPPAFLRQLQAARELNDSLVKAETTPVFCATADSGEMRMKLLREYHSKQDDTIRTAWSDDLKAAKVECANPVEDSSAALIATLTQATTDEVWQKVAALHTVEAQLDEAGVAAVRQKEQKEPPDAARAGERAMTKRKVETPWMRMVRNLQDSTALDTVKNEYTLHRQIHEWFAQGKVTDLRQLNDNVYSILFLMPATDPWLGLSTPDQFSGITNGGLVETQTAATEKK